MPSLIPENRKELAIKILKNLVREIREATMQKQDLLGYKHATIESDKFDTVHAQKIIRAIEELTQVPNAKEAE